MFRARAFLLMYPLVIAVACNKTPDVDEPNDQCPLSDARLTRMEEKHDDSVVVTEYFYDNSRRILRYVTNGRITEYSYLGDSAIMVSNPDFAYLRQLNAQREIIRSTATGLRGGDTTGVTVHQIFYSAQVGRIDSIQTRHVTYGQSNEQRETRRLLWSNGNVHSVTRTFWGSVFSPDTIGLYEYFPTTGTGKVPTNWVDVVADSYLDPTIKLEMNTSLWKRRTYYGTHQERDSVVLDAYNKVLSFRIRTLNSASSVSGAVKTRFRYECW